MFEKISAIQTFRMQINTKYILERPLHSDSS